ncbi:MAG TPA: DUF5681 domain-containing protein [Patescibacteria group bacterium]|nr:DUF5681 domain-containing protein [Patescibacteria group bacterium]
MADGNASNPVKQEENRKPGTWLPGQSGNPNGRPPKGHSITDTLREMMDEKPEIKRALGAKIFKLALEDGDMTAIKTLWAYIDGMPLQGIDVTSKGEALNPMVKIDTDAK